MGKSLLAACILAASHTYSVPPATLIGILHVEGGRVGQQSANTNGSYDLGPMQVNTIWMPKLAQIWKVDQKTAHLMVRDNGCVNIHVGAWILRQEINKTGGLVSGIAHYHSATPSRGAQYASRVISAMRMYGLI